MKRLNYDVKIVIIIQYNNQTEFHFHLVKEDGIVLLYQVRKVNQYDLLK